MSGPSMSGPVSAGPVSAEPEANRAGELPPHLEPELVSAPHREPEFPWGPHPESDMPSSMDREPDFPRGRYPEPELVSAPDREPDQRGEPFGPRPGDEADRRGPFGARPGGEPEPRGGFGPFNGEAPFHGEVPFGPRPGTQPDQGAPDQRGPFGPRPTAEPRGGFGPFNGEAPFNGGMPFGPRPDSSTGPAGFGSPASPPADDSDMPDVVPQSPARATATARATASARFAVPTAPEQPRSGPPFTEFTTDVAQRGAGAPYSEPTTDIAGREAREGDMPYAMPGRPETDATEVRMGGVFPGPSTRATVTPPSPDDTSNWPGREHDRFDQFKPETEPAKPETPHVRMLPILVSVVIGSVLLLGVVFGLVYLVAGGKDTLTVHTGDCVKRSGTKAKIADCGDSGSYQVVSIVDDKAKCSDLKQPYVINPTDDGKSQVLCLKPHA